MLLLAEKNGDKKMFDDLISERGIEGNVFDVIFNHWDNLVMEYGSEGDEGFVLYGRLWNGSARSDKGHGYIYSKKGNSQEVLIAKELCQNVCIIIDSIGNNDSIAEVFTHQGVMMKEIMDIVMYNVSLYERQEAVYEYLMTDAKWFIPLDKYFCASLVDWLMIYLTKVDSIFILDAGCYVVQVYFNNLSFSDGGDYCDVIWRRGDGKLQSLISIVFVVRKSLKVLFDIYYHSSSTLFANHAYISIYPPGDQVESGIHNIEHPVVCTSQRSPFSSENG
jgi:hypothetical protein